MIAMLNDLPPLVREAVRRLPKTGQPFPDTERVEWAKLMTVAFRWDYPEKEEPRPTAPPPVQQLQVFTQVVNPAQAAAKIVERVMADAKTNAGRSQADDPLLDAADSPFVRRFALPLRSGGLVKPGRIVMVGEGGVLPDEPPIVPSPEPPLVHQDRCAYGKPVEATAGYPCGQCDQVFDSKQALGGHVSTFHDPDRVEHACECGATFGRKVVLLHHMRTCPTVTKGTTFACEHCGEAFANRAQRAGHKRWCKARPGATDAPTHRTEDGDPVPTSVVPDDVVPQPGYGKSLARDDRAAEGGKAFLESLRWKPPSNPGDVSLGHKRRPEHEDVVRMASVDSAVPRFKV